MNTATDAMAKVQADTIEAVKVSQENMLSAVKAWGEAMSSFTPAVAMPGAEEAAKLFGNPTEMMDASFEFAAQVLELNKKFAHDLLTAATPAAE